MERGLITFSSFMNNKLFVIPIYQRNYSWEKEQLEDLWDDLYYLENGKKHYFGTILTKDTKEPNLLLLLKPWLPLLWRSRENII